MATKKRGFKNVASSIAAKEKVSTAVANAELAAASRRNKNKKGANPNLKKVKGAPKY